MYDTVKALRKQDTLWVVFGKSNVGARREE